jgi:hypothetical protein
MNAGRISKPKISRRHDCLWPVTGERGEARNLRLRCIAAVRSARINGSRVVLPLSTIKPLAFGLEGR